MFVGFWRVMHELRSVIFLKKQTEPEGVRLQSLLKERWKHTL